MIHGDALMLEVWNDGDAIPPDSVDKIFDPFWRRSTSDQREGVGLGLHICAQIVKAHHGAIHVISTKEDGTKFTVRLPVGLSSAE